MNPLFRIFVAAVLVNGVYDAARIAVSYRVLALGGDATSVGVVAATFSLLPMLFALRIGGWVDARGGRGMLLAGIAVSATASAGLAATSAVWALAVVNTALGLGQIMTMIGFQGLIMELTPPHRHVHGFAAFTLAVSIGQTIATPLAGLALQQSTGGLRGVVDTSPTLLCLAATLVAAIPFVISVRSTRTDVARRQMASSSDALRLLARPGMPAALFSALVAITGFDIIAAYLPVVGERVGLGPMVVSILITVRSAFSMLARAAMPLVLARWTQRSVLIIAPIVAAPACAVVALTPNAWTLAIALATLGFFWGMNQPVTMTWVTAVAPSHARATALSLRLAGTRAAQVGIPLAAGALATITGPAGAFWLVSLLSAAAGATSTLALRRHAVPALQHRPTGSR
ncbi:MFS transporter [Kribbia dieselivorans]|uniref:MFS transporter n=1 Tax=Kribbia dieselivorans TaxID=331526 RepID=UPI0008392250|nr:MFS transporter [Kribbia dieselivorans]